MNIILILIFISQSYGESLQPAMIANVIQAYNFPSTIIAKLCWSPHQIIELYKTLSEENIQISTADVINESDKQFFDIEEHVIFLADLNCQDIGSYFEKNIARNFFQAPFRWILLGNSDDGNAVVPDIVDSIDMLPDSQVIVIWENNNAYKMHFIYKISANNTWLTEYYGSWDETNRFQKSEDFYETTSLRRLDLKEYEISICYVLTNNESINHLDDNKDDHVDTITKVNFPTTNHLLDFLNARRKYVFADTWGYRVNGTWNGMTGYLVRGEVEVGGSPMFFTLERISIVDYIASPTPTRSKFVFQQPKLSYENNLFLLPFNTTVWYSTVVLVFLIYLVLFLVTKWEWKKTSDDIETREKDAGILRANVIDVVVLMFGAACQQGSPCELKGSLGRVVMLVLFLALMFLYTSYSANIVALLQSSSSHIKTLDDLLHSRIKFGVHDTVFNRYYFSTATEPTRKAIYEKKVAPPGTTPNFMTMDEGVIQMRKGLFAFHMETGVGYKFVGKYFNEGEKCGLREIQYLQVIDPWLAVRKNSPYREMFKIGYVNNREWIVEHYGRWNASYGLNKSEDRSISNAMRRKDLKGNPFTASLVISDNKTRYDYHDLSNIDIDPVTKSTYCTINNLYEFLNATRVAIFSDTWGYPVNGSWSGIIGDIYNGKADLCGSFTFINKERLHILEYIIVPASITKIKIVFRQPPLSYQHNLFVLPFTTNVWYCLGGFVFIITILLYINAKWDIKKHEDIEEKIADQTCLTPTWSDVIIFVLSAISQQGSSNELKGTLGRLVMFLVFLSFVFFYTSYSASIVVLLQATSDSIRTVTDLMNSKLELGIEDTVYNKFYFSESYASDPVRKAFYNAKIAPRGSKPNYLSLEEGVKRLQTKPFAFNMNLGLGYRKISEYFQEHEKCGLREIDYIQASKPWLCSKKNSPFTEMFKVGLFRVEEHGLSDRNNRKIFDKKPLCTVTSGNFGSVNMLDFYPVLLVLLYGMMLAVALLILEILVNRRQKMKSRLVMTEI
ncbi:uncharacterized protein LOC142974531 [Anticarsia gemmatalis]|uniref:uncharacterized protein LOC142974531 n=1 Tax=Anticarsia gemmatalis TaxID=129554 RepID=UPI003F77831C